MDVLPAYAGMIPDAARTAHRGACAPRVCGDDPAPAIRSTVSPSCSPRMRG